jgi:hypothetical protein
VGDSGLILANHKLPYNHNFILLAGIAGVTVATRSTQRLKKLLTLQDIKLTVLPQRYNKFET